MRRHAPALEDRVDERSHCGALSQNEEAAKEQEDEENWNEPIFFALEQELKEFCEEAHRGIFLGGLWPLFRRGSLL